MQSGTKAPKNRRTNPGPSPAKGYPSSKKRIIRPRENIADLLPEDSKLHAITSLKQSLFYIRLQFGRNEAKALVDTGAFKSAMPVEVYQRLIRDPSVLSKE